MGKDKTPVQKLAAQIRKDGGAEKFRQKTAKAMKARKSK